MNNHLVKIKILVSIIPLILVFFGIHNNVLAIESTMPDSYVEIIQPEESSKYSYEEDLDYLKSLNIPTYSWMPSKTAPKAIIIAVHGLTLHGRRYRVLARTLALHQIGLISMDMRGFGRCFFDEQNQFSSKTDNKKKIDHEKSYQDIVNIAKLVNDKYPDTPIIAMGESLGATFVIRLGAEHPEIINGVIASAPAVKVNPKMYASPSDVKAGVKAVLSLKHMVNLDHFINKLVSNNQSKIDEMKDDPFILKKLSLGDLIATDEFVGKTANWGKNIGQWFPILIIQGSDDGCVASKHVVDLLANMPSEDQRLAWKGCLGHLQLETIFIRASIIDTIAMWLNDHSSDSKDRLKIIESNIANVGGKLLK